MNAPHRCPTVELLIQALSNTGLAPEARIVGVLTLCAAHRTDPPAVIVDEGAGVEYRVLGASLDESLARLAAFRVDGGAS